MKRKETRSSSANPSSQSEESDSDIFSPKKKSIKIEISDESGCLHNQKNISVHSGSMERFHIETPSDDSTKGNHVNIKIKKKKKKVKKDLAPEDIHDSKDVTKQENLVHESIEDGVLVNANDLGMDSTLNESISDDKSRVKKKKKKHADYELKYKDSVEDKPSLSLESNKVQSNGNKKSLSIPISSLDNLLLKLDEIVEEDKKRHLQKNENHSDQENNRKENVSGYFSPTHLDTVSPCPTLNLSEINKKDLKRKQSDRSDISQERSTLSTYQQKMVPCKTNTHMPSTSNSVLNSVLSRFDEIIEVDRQKHQAQSIVQLRHGGHIEYPNQNEDVPDATNEDIVVPKVKKGSLETFEEESKERLYKMVKRLKNVDFELLFELPPIHKIASNCGHEPTEEQRKELEKAGIKLKIGKYTKEEDQKIHENWKLFCFHHHWDEEDVDPFLRPGALSKPKIAKFIQFISYNFEDRLMYNIYKRFIRLFKEINVRKFTPHEDEIIMNYVNNSGSKNPYSDLSFRLKRTRNALLKRYQKLKNKQRMRRRIKWDRYLTKELLHNIMKVTKSNRIYELKNRNITTKEWREISEKMDIPFRKLQRVWEDDVYTRILKRDFEESLPEVREKLLKRLSKKYKDWREIDWKEEAKKFDSFTHFSLYKVFRDLVHCRVPVDKRNDFRACLEYIKKAPIKTKRNKFSFINDIVDEIDNEGEASF